MSHYSTTTLLLSTVNSVYMCVHLSPEKKDPTCAPANFYSVDIL